MNRLSSIRFRLTLGYVFFLAVTVLIFALYLDLQLQNSLNTQLDDGLQVAASQLLINVDDSTNPPTFRSISDNVVDRLDQSRFAVRLVSQQGNVVDEVGNFPKIPIGTLQPVGFQTIDYEGTSWRIFTQRIQTHTKQFEVWLQTAQSLDIIDSVRSNLLSPLVIGIPLALIVAALGGIIMANRALRPVDTIAQTVAVLNATDMTRRIVYKGPHDELGRLTLTLNLMLDRLQSSFDTERQFTADASHELRTPLTAIKGQIDVTLQRQRTVEEYEATLYQIERETDRLIHLTNGLLFLARLDATQHMSQPEQLNLSDLLEAVVDQVRPLAEAKNIKLRIEIPNDLSVQGLPDHLIQLFLNVLDNAIKYTPVDGQVSLTAQTTGDNIVAYIQDNGPGISQEHIPYLFNRFYRAERASATGGTGLGLAISYNIALEHHGNLEVKTALGVGTTFIVSLPSHNSLS